MKHLWWGRIPLEDVGKHILIRGVRLSALGKLDTETIKMTAKLETPHHEGAGGTEDFTNVEAFQKHIRRVSNRLKSFLGRHVNFLNAFLFIVKIV